MLAKEWFSAAEMAALQLPCCPHTRAGISCMADAKGWQRPEWSGTFWRKRIGRGGGVEYHYALLPFSAQIALAAARLDLGVICRADRRRGAPIDLISVIELLGALGLVDRSSLDAAAKRLVKP